MPRCKTNLKRKTRWPQLLVRYVVTPTGETQPLFRWSVRTQEASPQSHTSFRRLAQDTPDEKPVERRYRPVSRFGCVYLMWRKCSASAFLLSPSYHPHYHPLMCLRLYTHGFLMVSIASAVFAPEATGETHPQTRRRQNGDMGRAGKGVSAITPVHKESYGCSLFRGIEQPVRCGPGWPNACKGCSHCRVACPHTHRANRGGNQGVEVPAGASGDFGLLMATINAPAAPPAE